MQLASARRLKVDRERVTTHCGRHVVALDRHGRIEPASDGYYFNETRFLSRFDLAPLRTLVIDPALPEWMPQATIRHLRVGEESVSLRLRREADGRTRHEVIGGGAGLRVLDLDPGDGVDRFALALAAALGR